MLYVNGVHNPSEPLGIKCSSPFRVTRTYEILFSSTGIQHDVRAHIITLEKFTKGFYILDFDLTPESERGRRRAHEPATLS